MENKRNYKKNNLSKHSEIIFRNNNTKINENNRATAPSPPLLSLLLNLQQAKQTITTTTPITSSWTRTNSKTEQSISSLSFPHTPLSFSPSHPTTGKQQPQQQSQHQNNNINKTNHPCKQQQTQKTEQSISSLFFCYLVGCGLRPPPPQTNPSFFAPFHLKTKNTTKTTTTTTTTTTTITTSKQPTT